jgi:hypothetical protein
MTEEDETHEEVINPKVLSDCYDFLHLIELGKGHIHILMGLFGSEDNLKESNFRQVERIKTRCQNFGIKVQFDDISSKFVTESNAKLRLLQIVEEENKKRKPQDHTSFGSYRIRKATWKI